jgi:hypothetical protein
LPRRAPETLPLWTTAIPPKRRSGSSRRIRRSGSLRHHEGGDVSIEGEKVDDPERYKGDPIPGGPTDKMSD